MRPDDFDLAQAWSSIVTNVDAQRAPVRVRLRADPTIVDVLRYMFGNRVGVGATGDRTGGSRWSYAPSPS